MDSEKQPAVPPTERRKPAASTSRRCARLDASRVHLHSDRLRIRIDAQHTVQTAGETAVYIDQDYGVGSSGVQPVTEASVRS